MGNVVTTPFVLAIPILVRNQAVPEADHLLSIFLRLCSDEASLLTVVRAMNLFESHSDDYGVPYSGASGICLCMPAPSPCVADSRRAG
jgi:hypothetical protein